MTAPVRIATLLMESHGLAPDVRSTSFASRMVWSKLYQAGSYFVDLHLAPDERGLRLRGEIMTQTEAPLPSEGTVTLHNRAGEIVATAILERDPLGGDAEFVFEIDEADGYHLEMVIDRETVSVAGLEIR